MGVPLEYSSSYLNGMRLHCFLLCFKCRLVLHFSIDNLQNLTILLFTPTSCIDFILSYVEFCQMVSGNKVLKFMFLILQSPYIVLILLIDHWNVYIEGYILFARLVVSCILPGLWRSMWVFYLWSCTWLLITWWVARFWLTCCLLILLTKTLILRLASLYFLRSSL